MENNYYDIACYDLQCMQIMIDTGMYNRISVDAQQIAEKMLKSVLELCIPLDDHVEKLMRGHNLKQLYLQIHNALPDFVLDQHDLASLKDYYFDAKYPGDNFVNVTYAECCDNVRIAYDVAEAVNRFRIANQLQVKSFTREMPSADYEPKE
ncbi:MAG: HEPN domain-containing protein [Blautia sp.]|nr:HEPN domain-containing protein [Blautia sp.]